MCVCASANLVNINSSQCCADLHCVGGNGVVYVMFFLYLSLGRCWPQLAEVYLCGHHISVKFQVAEIFKFITALSYEVETHVVRHIVRHWSKCVTLCWNSETAITLFVFRHAS